MRLDELDIDPRIVAKLKEEGIETLYPPQEKAIGPALARENVVLAIPTASGKSLVAYLAILQAVLRGGKALYISTGDFDEVDKRLHTYDVIVATSEKVDSLIRHRAKWLEQLTVVVADEVHLINDPDRGPTLEVILVKFRTFNPGAQLIALSATMRNSAELAAWLDAKLVQSDWRPVPLRQGVYCDGEVFFTDNTRRDVPSDDPVEGLVGQTLGSGGQALVFVNSRRSCESLALSLGPSVKTFLKDKDERLSMASRKLVNEQDEPTGMGARLARAVRNGCAFHHAGLTNAQRKLVESAFKAGTIGCIVATPTLAAGINLPARTVVVRDVKRYDSNSGFTHIPVLEVRQMCGRAGRPRYDKFGEAVLIAKNDVEKDLLLEEYLLGENENLYSKLGTEPAVRSHVLALVATNDAHDMEALNGFFERTFLAHQTDTTSLKENVESVVEYLRREGMLREGDELKATAFGRRVSDLYIDPKSAVIIRDALEKPGKKPEFGLLHAACSTPDMQLMYLRQSDYEEVEGYLESVEKEMILQPPDDLANYEIFLSEVKTARLLKEWVDETHENDIAEAFGVGPGDIRTKVDLAKWLVHATARLADLFNEDAVAPARELETRLNYGIRPELLELVKLRGVGRVRARALYSRGIRGLEDLRNTSYDRLKQIPTIGESVARRIKDQLGQSDPTIPAAPEDGQRSLVDFR
ncbi:MAG: DEAD/DEAH box helicase [Thermoplasmata archaeon]|nr:DEAD/DEAH box helicase [Thermoplasmata archaeon]